MELKFSFVNVIRNLTFFIIAESHQNPLLLIFVSILLTQEVIDLLIKNLYLNV